MSPLLEQSLQRLNKLCFLAKTPSGSDIENCGMLSYSPLTFFYVMCDLIRRGGFPATVIETFQPPSSLRTSVEAIQAWKERRPVWRVNVCIKFGHGEESVFDGFWNKCALTLRLFLAPHSVFLAAGTCEDKFEKLLTSAEGQFIDNLDVNVKRKENGEIDVVDTFFLLADRNLLKTHYGVIVTPKNKLLLAILDPITTNNRDAVKVEKFTQPYPWGGESILATSAGLSSEGSKKLTAISCQESNDAFTFRVNFHPDGGQPSRSGIIPSSTQFCS